MTGLGLQIQELAGVFAKPFYFVVNCFLLYDFQLILERFSMIVFKARPFIVKAEGHAPPILLTAKLSKSCMNLIEAEGSLFPY